jgi:hypothetical protein
VKTAPALHAADIEFKGRIDAQADASVYAAMLLQDSNSKTAILGPLGVIKTLVGGSATDQQKTEALAPVLLALQGKLTEAQAGWQRALDEAGALKTQIATLEATVKREREAAAIELARQLQDARDQERRDAEAAQRKLVGWIFFGGGFVLGLLAVGCLVYAPTVPQLGPRAALGFGAASAGAVATGVAVLQLMNHPEVVWWGLGLIAVSVVAALAMIYSNHLHATRPA